MNTSLFAEELEKGWDMVFESYPDAILIFDAGLRLTFANFRAREILKDDEKLSNGCFFSALFPDAPLLDAILLHNMPSGVVLESGKWLLKKSHDRKERVRARLVSLTAGEEVGLMVCFEPDRPCEVDIVSDVPDLSHFGFISRSHALLHIQATIYDIAQSGSNVLIMGETGTGKELLANVIHGLSPRRDGPIVKINCGAIPENLLEAELFGYKRGAFTDARTDKPGRFQLARGGTIVLDEIGDMPLNLQVKLLRALETQQVDPLGSVRPEHVDVRIVSSTNQDLWKLTEQGKFRRDLFFRINVMSLVIPPLRERIEDIPLLAESFINDYCLRHSRPRVTLSDKVVEMLMGYTFYGNIRELHNILEHALVLCKESEILPSHLPFYVSSALRAECRDFSYEERETIRNALKESGGHLGVAAGLLHIHRSTLWRKMKKLGLDTAGRS